MFFVTNLYSRILRERKLEPETISILIMFHLLSKERDTGWIFFMIKFKTGLMKIPDRSE